MRPAAQVRPSRWTSVAALLCTLALAGTALPADAQYKQVDENGRISYGDLPPLGAQPRPGQTRRDRVEIHDRQALPAELQPLALSHPVLLITAPDCQPCDAGRRLLQARGIPYAERLVLYQEDVQRLEQLTAATDLPVLRVGQLWQLGWLAEDWQRLLDQAGYPRQSRLSARWTPASPLPLSSGLAPDTEAPPAARPPSRVDLPESTLGPLLR
jgi:glutaredoxin